MTVFIQYIHSLKPVSYYLILLVMSSTTVSTITNICAHNYSYVDFSLGNFSLVLKNVRFR